MLITIKRYHNRARLHLVSGLWLSVYAELNFVDRDTSPTSLHSQLLDWQGVLTFDRPPPGGDTVELSVLYESPRLQLCSRTAEQPHGRFLSLPLVPCEIGDVTLTRERVKIAVQGPLTGQPLSRLLSDHYSKLTD